MLKGRLGLEKARIPHADRHGLLWLSRGELCVIDGCLHFLRGKDSLTFMVQLPPPPIMKETMGRQAAGPGRDMFWWL
jgi:CRISPR-associated protein Cas1